MLGVVGGQSVGRLRTRAMGVTPPKEEPGCFRMTLSRFIELAVGVLVFGGLAVWIGMNMLRQSDAPKRLVFKWGVSVCMMAAIVWLIFVIRDGNPFAILGILVLGMTLGLIWAPAIAETMANPLTDLYVGGGEGESKPFYSMAEGRRRRGEIPEAIAAVRTQLERYPNDHAGIVLLATIQADDLKDLAAAEETILTYVHNAKPEGPRATAALSLLADFHLKHAQDPASAHSCLQKIIDLFPDTEHSSMASQRISRLPTAENLASNAAPALIELKHVPIKVGLQRPAAPTALTDEVREEDEIQQCQSALEAHPLDFDMRERLVQLLAARRRDLEGAHREIEFMIRQPTANPRQIKRWLNMHVDLETKYGVYSPQIEEPLRRLIRRYPGSAAAEAAQARLAGVRGEFRNKSQTDGPDLKMGDYEKDLGLKD